MSRSVDVHLSAPGGDVLVGRAFFATHRGSTSTTFRYDDRYLAYPRGGFALDPALPLFTGQHAVADGLPYCFTDCAPDRWGRNLIRKRAQAAGVEAGRTRRDVSEVDYLLGVSDLTRQGALRFTEPAHPDGPFLAPDADVPTLLELPRLLHAADQVEQDPDDLQAVKTLLDAGTGSLGGARPKASVRDGDRLLIAKFASPRDEWDVIAWEKTVLDLADRAGLRVPGRRLERIAGRSVLLLDRFDRTAAGGRVPYASAMTLLTARDGDGTEVDYVDLAEALAEQGDTSVKHDLAELWRRVAFSVAVHNTDDHLRNHGFLRGRAGWTLSPLFDVNPEPDVSRQRQLGIGTAHARDEEVDGLLSAAPSFGLSGLEASRALREVMEATATWRDVATGHGIPRRELSLMADAFDGLRAQLRSPRESESARYSDSQGSSGQDAVRRVSSRLVVG